MIDGIEYLAACRTLLGRAATSPARAIFLSIVVQESPLLACESSKNCPRAVEYSPRPPKPGRLPGRIVGSRA